tara:strand:- start:52 stop:600 length:549 start_codon:yes stop_codon:yes gene_type:complete
MKLLLKNITGYIITMDILLAPDYTINENGDVYSKERVVEYVNGRKRTFKCQLMKQWMTNKGYLEVSLTNDKKQKHYLVHRLISIAFIPNPNNFPCVNHIDCNRSNNSISNLEWCTNMYNNQSINTNRDFGSIKKTKCNTYQAQYNSNGITHYKNFKTEEEAEIHLVMEEMILKLEAEYQKML